MGRSLGRSFSKAIDHNKLRRLGVDDGSEDEIYEEAAAVTPDYDDGPGEYTPPDRDPSEEEDWREYLDAEGKFTGVRHPKTPEFDEYDLYNDDAYEGKAYDGKAWIESIFCLAELAKSDTPEDIVEKNKQTSAWEEYIRSLQ